MNKATEYCAKAMGGSFLYKAYPQALYQREEVQALFEQAHQEVLRIEAKFTEFHESVITRINDKAGREESILDDELFFLLKKSQIYYEKSKGLFDPTYASYLARWREGELGFFEKIKWRTLVDFKKVKINENKRTIFLPYKGQRIGLGGIGKGYAVDRAFEILRDKGLANFSVNGAGDMRVHSNEGAPRKWKVGIRNPFSADRNRSAGMVQIENGSVSTSGSYIQNKGDLSDHHIVHHYNAENKDQGKYPVSCTVVGESCMDTDVWATIAMTQDIPSSMELLNHERIYAILIDRLGKSYLSARAMENFAR